MDKSVFRNKVSGLVVEFFFELDDFRKRQPQTAHCAKRKKRVIKGPGDDKERKRDEQNLGRTRRARVIGHSGGSRCEGKKRKGEI